MLRKFALGLVAAGALGLAAFAPTAASAHDGQGFGRDGYGHGMHRGWYGANAYFRHHHPHNCLQQRPVWTPWGYRYRMVNVCRY